MYDDLMQLIERCRVAFPKFGNGVPQEAVIRAETALGLRLPESYKWWLVHYGGGQIKGDVIYGLDPAGTGRPDLMELAKMNERDGLYEGKDLVFAVGNAENFYFDTTEWKNGEYVVFQHDIAQNERIPYAQSFAEFLQRRLREVYQIQD